MDVKTVATSDRVRSSVAAVVGLLAADHPSPCARSAPTPAPASSRPWRSGSNVATARCTEAGRTGPPTNRRSLIAVDHDACILCDRCIRGCNDVKNNQVLGRMGKGYGARIAFDLDAPMGDVVVRLVRRVHGLLPDRRPDVPRRRRRPAHRTASTRRPSPSPSTRPRRLPARDPRALSRASRARSSRFNERRSRGGGSSRARSICTQGEYGSTAFYIESGSAEIAIEGKAAAGGRGPAGWLGLVPRRPPGEVAAARAAGSGCIPVDAPLVVHADRPERDPRSPATSSARWPASTPIPAPPPSARARPAAPCSRCGATCSTCSAAVRRIARAWTGSTAAGSISTVLTNVPFLAGLDETFRDELAAPRDGIAGASRAR